MRRNFVRLNVSDHILILALDISIIAWHFALEFIIAFDIGTLSGSIFGPYPSYVSVTPEGRSRSVSRSHNGPAAELGFFQRVKAIPGRYMKYAPGNREKGESHNIAAFSPR